MAQTVSLQTPSYPVPQGVPDHNVAFAKACRCGERLEAHGQCPAVAARLIAEWDRWHRGEGHEPIRTRVGGSTRMAV